MQIKQRDWRILLIAFLALGGGLIFAVFNLALVRSPTFTYIPLTDWVRSGSFPLVILQPEPPGTELRMGPLQGADRVELHYTGEFEAGTLPAVYELYESDKPLPIGKEARWGILPDYRATDKDVEIEHIKLMLFGNEHRVELRRNREQADAGIVIFEIGGTHVVYHWQNVEQEQALQALVEGITLLRPRSD